MTIQVKDLSEEVPAEVYWVKDKNTGKCDVSLDFSYWDDDESSEL